MATLSRAAAQRTGLLWLVNGQADEDVGGHGDRVGADDGPGDAVGRSRDAVKMFPLRTSLTQYGRDDRRAGVDVETPPVARRRWNVRPLPGVRNIDACVEPVASVSRIMTPALAHGSVFWMLATRATIVPSPLSGWYT